MKFGVVVFPGSNCDHDCHYALSEVLKQDVEYIWHQYPDVSGFDCIVLPGGFSYGDYLRTGSIARFSKVMNSIIDFAKKGGLVIGICNGFQILLESGLLPGAMLRNKTVKFICKHVDLRVDNINTPFTSNYKKGQVVSIPIAHGEGNYYIDENGLKDLIKNNQVAFRYSNPDGSISQEHNPNGSVDNIAGIVNKKGNVLGMMPHPERCSEKVLGSDDGYFIFKSMVQWLNGSKRCSRSLSDSGLKR